MNLIFMRHGEATDNVKELISDKEIYWSLLTEDGIKAVKESVEYLPNNIDVMYVSPLPRTIETAHYVFEKYSTINVIMEDRIREIQYGKYSHCKNNEELDETRKKQIAIEFSNNEQSFGSKSTVSTTLTLSISYILAYL